MRTEEQILHDKINLPRLLKCLEQSIQDSDWSKTNPPNRETWIKAQGTLQQIRHARLLLKNIEVDNLDPTPAEERRYQHFRTTLKHLEEYMRQVEHQLTPPVRRPTPLLPSIRPPPPKPAPAAEPTSPPVEATLLPAETTPSSESPPSIPDVQHLLPPDPVAVSLSPASGPSRTATPAPPGALALPAASTITATPTILQNSRARYEELSEQLAVMATQLRRNATHFSLSLEQDKSIVVTMQEKVEGNFEFMKRERLRLRDFEGRAGARQCLVIMSVVVVLIAFMIMVFIIRLTR
ncbi:hypothetical protein JVU11DRAFT_2895 [Chiua virens]|nr:hypothetical protein JVU11DRAFT_2895 [Chiua virens]